MHLYDPQGCIHQRRREHTRRQNIRAVCVGVVAVAAMLVVAGSVLMLVSALRG